MSLSPHLGGGWYLQTELKIPGAQLCCLTTNKSKRVTNPTTLIPNVAFCFRGPEMTILLGLLFGPCLFHL